MNSWRPPDGFWSTDIVSDRARRLHDTPWMGVFFLTGGGSPFAAELLSTPGASRTVLELRVPYAPESMTRLLKRQPDQFCSDTTARQLAVTAWLESARWLSAREASDEFVSFGLGLTASLATDRIKRGEMRAHLAIQTGAYTYSSKIAFDGADRATQEQELTDAIWSAIDSLSSGRTPVQGSLTAGTDAWRQLLLEEVGAVPSSTTTQPARQLIFPGSFNPLHAGHEAMLAYAERRTRLAGTYELSAVNPDKPSLDFTAINRRIAQFDRPVWLTSLPTFAGKAREFPGATFVCGVDTLVRIAHPRYYGSTAERNRVLKAFTQLDTRFIVFGRNTGRRFDTLNTVRLPQALRARCIGVTEEEYRMDISSTELRNAREA